jgi:hypothetical protein
VQQRVRGGKLVNELLERLRGRMLHPDLGVDLAVDLTAAAYARLQAARSLIAAGHPTKATSELALVRTFYREVQAHAYLAEAEAFS